MPIVPVPISGTIGDVPIGTISPPISPSTDYVSISSNCDGYGQLTRGQQDNDQPFWKCDRWVINTAESRCDFYLTSETGGSFTYHCQASDIERWDPIAQLTFANGQIRSVQVVVPGATLGYQHTTLCVCLENIPACMTLDTVFGL